jgi:hypothetical protein
MTYQERSDLKVKLMRIARRFFLEDYYNTYDLYYLEANPSLFPQSVSLEDSLNWFDDFYFDCLGRTNHLFVFAGDDRHGLPTIHENYINSYDKEVKEYHVNPHDQNLDVAWDIRWKMERVCGSVNNRIWSHYHKGLVMAMFLQEYPPKPMAFYCLPVVFPDPPIPQDKAILRKLDLRKVKV